MTKKYEKESESDRRKGRKISNKCDEDTGKTNSISNVKTCLFLHHKQTQQQQPNFIVAWQLQTQQSCSTTPSFTFSFCPFSTVQNSMWWAKSISTEHKSSFYLERWAANLNFLQLSLPRRRRRRSILYCHYVFTHNKLSAHTRRLLY